MRVLWHEFILIIKALCLLGYLRFIINYDLFFQAGTWFALHYSQEGNKKQYKGRLKQWKTKV